MLSSRYSRQIRANLPDNQIDATPQPAGRQQRQCCARGQLACRYGAQSLLWVLPVGFQVSQVIDDINDTREQAEQNETCKNAQEGRPIGELLVEYQCNE
jgi:hypothetical protein